MTAEVEPNKSQWLLILAGYEKFSRVSTWRRAHVLFRTQGQALAAWHNGLAVSIGEGGALHRRETNDRKKAKIQISTSLAGITKSAMKLQHRLL